MKDENSQDLQHDVIEYVSETVSILFKRRRRITWVFFGILALVGVGTFLLSPVYEANSALLVKFGREFVYHPEIGDKPPVSVFNQEEAVNSAVSILRSREIVERVLTSIGVTTMYDVGNATSADSAITSAYERFRRSLEIEPVKKSSVINISFEHEDPKIAADALNLLVKLFVERHLELHSQSSSDFFQKQLSFFRAELATSEDRLQEFKRTNRISSLQEQRSLLLQQRSELDTAFKAARSRIDEAESKLSSFRRQMNDINASDDRYTESELDKVLVDSRSKLLGLKLDEQQLSAKYNDDNPLLVTTRKQIRVIEQFLRDQERSIASKVKSANPAYRMAENEARLAEAELEAFQARADSVQKQMEQLDSELQVLDLREKELRELQREVTLNEESFRIYQTKLEESRIQDEMNRQQIANVSIVQSAVVPTKPVKPRKTLNLIVGLLLACVSAVGVALLSEFGAQSFVSSRGVERRMGLPVLTSVPYVPANMADDVS